MRVMIAHHVVERWHRVRRKAIDRVPLPFLTNAHELALAGALILLGGSLLIGEARPGSVTSQVPFWMTMSWAVAIFSGGILTYWGVFRGRTRREWAGQLLAGYGCAFYAGAVGTSVPFKNGAVVVFVFTLLAVVSFWRAFKITMTPYVQTRLAREATAAALRINSDGDKR